MSHTTAEVAPVVENCISSDESPIGDQLHPSSGKNGLVNGLVHPKKSRRNRKNKGGKKPAEEIVEKDIPKVGNHNHCTNNIVDAIDHNNLKSEEKGTENNQSPNIVNNVNNLKIIDQEQQIVDVDCNHKLDKANSEFSTTKNHISNDLTPTKSLSEEHEIPSEININSSISDLCKDIEHLDIEKKFEEESNCDKKIDFVQYESELQMPMIMKIIQKDLSEPYSIYTYRYFIHNWPKLCFLAMCEDECVGAIVCKLDVHRKVIRRGYIAMLAVDQNYRKLKIGSTLVQMAIHEMTMGDADEVVLETEVTNKPALKLYEKLGFVRDKRLFRYYLNGVDALRLKLWLR